MPSLKEVSAELRSSEEEQESNGSESEEDWKSARKEGGNSGESPVDSEGSAVESWELFGFSGVRHNSV
jgi:hypothetical protein